MDSWIYVNLGCMSCVNTTIISFKVCFEMKTVPHKASFIAIKAIQPEGVCRIKDLLWGSPSLQPKYHAVLCL